jgi:alpha-galactosidase
VQFAAVTAMRTSLFYTIQLFSVSRVLAINNGMVRVPPLGYSTWNYFPNVAINESVCYQLVDALVEKGLVASGYTVFVVDEPCFTGRDASGDLITNNKTWPHGFKAFGDYLHARGMAFGIYTDQGPTTCGGCIASEGYETQDMSLFASFGVDYVKVDSCNRPVAPEHWAVFRDALNATGRHIAFSIIAQGQDASWVWGNATGNLWRTTYDIMNTWAGVMANLDGQV